jgi:hypothetical protein
LLGRGFAGLRRGGSRFGSWRRRGVSLVEWEVRLSFLVPHNLHVVVVVLATTNAAQRRPERALLLLPALRLLSKAILLRIRRSILSPLRPPPLLPHLRRNLTAHALNSQPLHQRVNTIPLLQREQLRLLSPSRCLCVGILSSIDCLRLVVVAVVARFFYVPVIIFDNCDNAALATLWRSESAATRAARVGDASARRGRVLGVVAAHERFWRAAGEWAWGH